MSKSRSPILSIVMMFIITWFSLNRLLFFYEKYLDFNEVRTADILYTKDFCLKVKSEEMGHYNNHCLDAKRRIATPVFIQAFEFVLNETVHINWKWQHLWAASIGLSVVVFINNLHSKFIFDGSRQLPYT